MNDPNSPGAAARAADILLDCAGLAGACLITHGVDLVSRPAAFIVAGMFMLSSAWLAARKCA